MRAKEKFAYFVVGYLFVFAAVVVRAQDSAHEKRAVACTIHASGESRDVYGTVRSTFDETLYVSKDGSFHSIKEYPNRTIEQFGIPGKGVFDVEPCSSHIDLPGAHFKARKRKALFLARVIRIQPRYSDTKLR